MKLGALALVSGCAIGGGPVIGVGQRGWYGGVEAGGGVVAAELAAGATLLGERRVFYARVDLGIDGAAEPRPPGDVAIGSWRGSPGGMLGLGAAYEQSVVRAMVVLAPSYSLQLAPLGTCTQRWIPAVGASLSLRYDGAWSVAFAPRISAALPYCEGT